MSGRTKIQPFWTTHSLTRFLGVMGLVFVMLLSSSMTLASFPTGESRQVEILDDARQESDPAEPPQQSLQLQVLDVELVDGTPLLLGVVPSPCGLACRAGGGPLDGHPLPLFKPPRFLV